MRFFASRPAAALAALAAVSMSASPALAHGYGGWGGGGWGGYRHHHDGLDGGDLLAGLLIFGGVAAVAAAASNASHDRDHDRYPAPEQPAPDRGAPDRYGDAPPERDYQPGSATYRDARDAMDACSAEIERGDRTIDSVDEVAQESDGYRVDGRMRDGQAFTCAVDRDGRIRHLELDGRPMS